MGDEIGDRDLLEPVGAGELRHLFAAGHSTVVIDQFADHADRRQVRELAEINRSLGMAGAHQHAAFAGNERKDVAGTDEIRRARIGVGEVADRQRPIVSGNAGGGAVLVVDRDGEGSRMRRIIFRHHGREIEPLGFLARHRRADDARRVAHDERHLFRRAVDGGDDQVAFVLAPVIIGDDDDFACLEGPDGLHNTLLIIGHRGISCQSSRPVWPRSRR